MRGLLTPSSCQTSAHEACDGRRLGRGTLACVVRHVALDELAWFLTETLRFAGHGHPGALGRDLTSRLRDPRRDAERCWVDVSRQGAPTAGAVVRPPHEDDDERTVALGPMWFVGDVDAARGFVREVLASIPHDAVVVDVSDARPALVARLEAWLHPLGFDTRRSVRMVFPLVDTPPLGAPYAIEAWTPENDAVFKNTVEASEGRRVSEARWSWWKRKGGAFRPDTWFVHRITPDQDPVGYALCHGEGDLDGAHVIEAAGVVASERGSTEAVRRLLITTLLELAAMSPWGTATIDADDGDPKWARILERIGFDSVSHRVVLERRPD